MGWPQKSEAPGSLRISGACDGCGGPQPLAGKHGELPVRNSDLTVRSNPMLYPPPSLATAGSTATRMILRLRAIPVTLVVLGKSAALMAGARLLLPSKLTQSNSQLHHL